MADLYLYFAGGIGLTTSLVHQFLGQKYVLATIHAPAARTTRLLSAVWQLSTLYWAGASVLLIVTPHVIADAARTYTVIASAAILASGAIANFWAMKGRHPGWALLGTASVLAILGQ